MYCTELFSHILHRMHSEYFRNNKMSHLSRINWANSIYFEY